MSDENKWVIVPTFKSSLTSDGTLNICFNVLLGGDVKANLSVFATPEQIRDEMSKEAQKFIANYTSYSTEGIVPEVNEEITLNI